MSTFRSPRGRIDVPAQFIGALLAAFVLSLVLTVAPAFAGSFATVQGQSKGTATWVSGNLSGWQELDLIPMRVLIDPSSADVNNVSTITIEYDHTKTKGGSVYQGLDRPRGFAVAPGDESKIQCLNCAAPVRSEPTGSDTWSVTFQVRPLVAAPSAITFQARLRAGAHYFTGSSLALGGSATPGSGLGLLQVVKPQAKNGSPDLQLTKTGPSVAAPGSTVAYTLNFGNKFTATSPATGIQLTDTLPSGVTYTSGCVAPACSVSADGRTVVWDLGDLDVGTSGSVSFIATVAAGLPYGTVLTNTAEIDSAENDANLADNRASATTEVHFNRAPAATAQSGSTDEDTAKTITLSGSDPDSNSLTYTITSLPANGTLYDGGTPITSVGPSGYVLSGNQVSYLPDANYNGPDSFAFKTSDGSLDSSTATVSLDVTPVNDAPVASASPATPTIDEDTQATVTLSGSDLETAAADLKFTITALPAHGSLTKDGSALAAGDSFTGSPADVVYTPDANYNGSDSFTFKVTDRGDPDNCGTPSTSCDDAKSDTKTVSLDVSPVNDAPTASASDGNPGSSANSAQLPEDTQATVTLSGSDLETAAADLKFTITALPAHGSLAKDGSALAAGDSFTGSPADVVYTPDANYNGPDSFAFKTSDGSLDSSAATVSLDVTPVNDAPVAHDDHSPSTIENAPPITIDLRPLVSDVETSNAYLAYTIVSGPSHGVLQEISGTNGTFSYRPDANHNGSDSFTYEVTDRGDPDNCTGDSSVSCSDRLDSEVKTVPITIKPSPAPTASPTPTVQVVLTRPRIETVPIKKIAKLPRYCASRRHFGIRLRGPHGDPLVKAQVFVNGRQVKVIRGRRLTSQVDLRGLPNGRFTVTIIVTTESGRQLKGSRRYRTCTPRIVRKHKRPPKV